MILAGQSAQIKRLLLAGFLTLPTGEHVSHLQVHRGLLERVARTPWEETE